MKSSTYGELDQAMFSWFSQQRAQEIRFWGNLRCSSKLFFRRAGITGRFQRIIRLVD
jgi:hypothetical protein